MTPLTTLFRFQLCLLLIGIGSLQPLLAQSNSSAQNMNLEECIQYGLDHSTTLENARFDEYIAAKKVDETFGLGFPQVSVSGDIIHFPNITTSILPGELNFENPGQPFSAAFGLPWNASLGASVNQLIFDGRYFLGVKAAKVYETLSAKSTARTAEEIAYEVSKAYYTVLVTQANKQVLGANIERLEKMYNETSALNKEGFVEKLDVERLEISLNNLKAEMEKISRLANLSVDLLKFQMGMSVSDALNITGDLDDFRPQPAPTAAITEFDVSNRIEYSLLQTQLDLAGYDLKRYKVERYPSLYAFGNYQQNWQWQKGSSFDFPTSNIGLKLSIPIFDGGQRKNIIQQKKLEQKKVENDIRNFENGALLEVRRAVAELDNAYASFSSQKRNKELAKKVYDITNIKYKEGVGSSLEVKDSETQLKEAESNYLSSLYAYFIAQLDLEKAMGHFAQYHPLED